MGESEPTSLDWLVREAVYRHFAWHGERPSRVDLATALGIEPDVAQAALERLHQRHALFLDQTSREIRMANPFSALPTPFRVLAGAQGYWATCAWDAFGIPAALHADARIEAHYAEDGVPVAFAVEAGRVRGPNAVVHFPLPARRWYDDLIET